MFGDGRAKCLEARFDRQGDPVDLHVGVDKVEKEDATLAKRGRRAARLALAQNAELLLRWHERRLANFAALAARRTERVDGVTLTGVAGQRAAGEEGVVIRMR